MVTIFLSDIHNHDCSQTIKNLEGLFKKEKPDKMVFLGDVDLPEIYKWIWSLDTEKRIVVGNHEYAWCKKQEIGSSWLQQSPQEYFEMWEKSSLRSGVLEALEKEQGTFAKIITEKVDGRKLVYSHCPIVWGKSLYVENCYRLSRGLTQDAFMEMKKRKWGIWFKGHDHLSQVLSIGIDKSPYETEPEEENTKTRFKKNKRYIVNVPAFAEGSYALLDENTWDYEAKKF